jgi:hypothetical protein
MGSFEVAVIAGILAAICTQVLTSLAKFYEQWTQKNLVRKVLIQDLEKQRRTLIRLRSHYITLALKFRKCDTTTYQSDAFQDLHSGIYEGITKVELFQAFTTETNEVVEIYNVIGFLKANRPYDVYGQFVKEWEKHCALKGHKEQALTSNHKDIFSFKCEVYFEKHEKYLEGCRTHAHAAKLATMRIDKLLKSY